LWLPAVEVVARVLVKVELAVGLVALSTQHLVNNPEALLLSSKG
jgi:hypothetical protein